MGKLLVAASKGKPLGSIADDDLVLKHTAGLRRADLFSRESRRALPSPTFRTRRPPQRKKILERIPALAPAPLPIALRAFISASSPFPINQRMASERVHGVVRHFSPSPPPLLSFPAGNASNSSAAVRNWTIYEPSSFAP